MSENSNKEPTVELETFNELIKAIVEHDATQINAETDAFEQYADKVQSRLHADANVFQKRFVAGYASLLKQLKYEQSGHEITKPYDKHL